MKIEFLTMPGCGACEAAKPILEKLKDEFKFELKETDISTHPELIEKYQIMSSPGIVIDGKLEFTGGITEDQLREKLGK